MPPVALDEDAVAFWDISLTVAGGVYTLCWCSKHADCETADKFQVPLGAGALTRQCLFNSYFQKFPRR